MRKIVFFEKDFAFIIVGLLICSGLGLIPTQTQATITKSGYDLIIITSADFSNEVQPLVIHKEQHGIATKIITLDDIYNGIYFDEQGRDDAEKIKYFIKNAYDFWNISYVLFIGDTYKIPFRLCNTNVIENMTLLFTSELYYADIYDANGDFSSWDSDEDGIYGEWYFGAIAEDKNIDLKPDIAVGRIPCTFPIEVKIIVNKIIQYEITAADPSWFKKLVVAGGDGFIEYPGNEGEIMTQNVIDVMTGFTPVKLWVSTGAIDPFGISIMKAINQGCGFLYMAGHGNWWIWAANANDLVGFFPIFRMPLLRNHNKYPICVTTGCHNSKIEKSCWSWHMLKQPFGGSIATIGSTSVGYSGLEYGGGGIDWLELHFFTEYSKGTDILGKIWKNVITSYVSNFSIDWEIPAGENCAIDAKMVQEWIILGDPTLKIGGYS